MGIAHNSKVLEKEEAKALIHKVQEEHSARSRWRH